MTALTFAYNHARDPMNPDDLADKIASSLSLTSAPTVDINPTQIIVTHASITSGNTAAIQALINAYTLDAARVALPPGSLGTLLGRAQQAVATNNTFIAIASPTAAQVATQAKALTRQNSAVIKVLLQAIAGQAITDTSGT